MAFASQPVPLPLSPAVSDEASRSESSSDTTLPNTSRTLDSSFDDEDDNISDFSSELVPGVEPKSGDSEISGSSPALRRRAGQHFNKRRHRTSAEQLRVLEMTYAGNKVPNQELRKDLATQLGMTNRRVQIWFQNKRAKEKRLRSQSQLRMHPTSIMATTSSASSTSSSSVTTLYHGPSPPVSSFMSHHPPPTIDSFYFPTQERSASFPMLVPDSAPVAFEPAFHLSSNATAHSHSFVGSAPPTLSSLLANSAREAQQLSWIPQPATAPLYYSPYLQLPPSAFPYPPPHPSPLNCNNSCIPTTFGYFLPLIERGC